MDEPPFALVRLALPASIVAKGGSFFTVSTLVLFSSTSIACGFLVNKKGSGTRRFRCLFGTGSGGRTHTVAHWNLNPARLPIPPYPHICSRPALGPAFSAFPGVCWPFGNQPTGSFLLKIHKSREKVKGWSDFAFGPSAFSPRKQKNFT